MAMAQARQQQQRKRAGEAVEARLDELHESAASVARRAAVDPKTVRGLISGVSWPTVKTRDRIEKALGWPGGTLVRRAMNGDGGLATYSIHDLLAEVCRRMSNDR